MTCLGFDRTDCGLPDWSRNFDLVTTFSQLKSIFCVFFFFPKLHLAAYKEAQSTFILLCQYPMHKLQTITFILTSLHVNPFHIKSGHFDASLKCQMTLCLYLPPCARRSPWPDFGWV